MSGKHRFLNTSRKTLSFKFFSFGFSLFSLLLISNSCNNDLKILAPYKDITIVYGLMDQNDPVHYFRINKAFEGPGNAYAMASNYDSIYYPVGTIHAYIQDSSTLTNSIVDTFNLDTTTAIPLGPGTFSNPKQLLYYTTARNAPLNPNDYYNLIIVNTKTGKRLTGSTPLLQDLAFTSPAGFASTPTFSITFNTQAQQGISWTSSPGGRIYQMDIRLYYAEIQTSSGDSTFSYIDWLFPTQTCSSLGGLVQMDYQFTAEPLYTLIASILKPNLGYTRHVTHLDVIFTTGSDDLNTYVLLSQPPQGINQDVPTFTDVKNGVGLYTARHVQIFNKQLGPANTDSLCYGSVTGNLGFQP